MIFSRGLVVSLPSRELRSAVLPGSLFQIKDLATQPISGTLRAALRLLGEKGREAGQTPVLIARPEIFLHGESRAWLMKNLGAIEDHLNISDGSTIQLVPGMRNHLFFYNPGLARNMNAFERFVGRAPEVPPQISLQINTAFTFRTGAASYTPQSLLLQARHFFPAGEPEYRKFYLNPNSVPDSVARIEATPRIGAECLNGFTDVIYIPFTDSAASDRLFCRFVARQVLIALKSPGKSLILGTPLAQDEHDTFSRMISLLLTGLSQCGIVLPRATFSNVVITSNLVDDDLFASPDRRCHLVMPETFEFWRCPLSYYEKFASVSVTGRSRAGRDILGIMELLTKACGRVPESIAIEEEFKASVRSRHDDE